MVIVTSGKTKEGKLCSFYLDARLKKQLDVAKHRVLKKNWDYVSIISGIPGSGKSTFVRSPAKYCCPWFSLKYVAFTAKEFIKITNNCPNYSAVILDESFQSLNTRITMSPEFRRIISHLQLLRQKHLFIFLCLPNFFDLTKGVAIFRASHLFVTYASKEGSRGRFMAWGRNEKRKLYVKGSKYLDLFVVDANFKGRYTKAEDIISEKDYEELKLRHLKEQDIELAEKIDPKEQKLNKMIIYMYDKLHLSFKKIGEIIGMTESNVRIRYLKGKGVTSMQELKNLT